MSTVPQFREKNRTLQAHAVRVLRAERPMTLRALYYRLASAGHLPATDAGYNRLKRLTKALRESGQVPITGWIVDRVRSAIEGHIDQDRWRKLKRVEELEQGVLVDFVGRWREKPDLVDGGGSS